MDFQFASSQPNSHFMIVSKAGEEGVSIEQQESTDKKSNRKASMDVVEVRDPIPPATHLEKQKTQEGEAHFHRLGWKRLTIILIVEAIALGSLSLPAAFASLGMVAGVICCVGLGLVAIYTSHLIGLVKLKYPHVSHYGEAMGLIMGKFGFELGSAMFILQLILLVGSHCLTGTIAFSAIIQDNTCSVVYGVVSAAILFLLAIPPSFTEVAILGYIDFVSILLAIGITIVATGIKARSTPANWSAWPQEGTTFTDAFLAVTNIVFAYSFAMCQFSFLDEMHTPEDYYKSIWALGIVEIAIYTITGATIYVFVGADVKSPALLSAGSLISRVAFGVALPVIFISGAINLTVAGRYVHGRLFRDSISRYINTSKGWMTWLTVLAVLAILSFVSAEAIPIFYDLLGICSALFVSGFSFYLPPVMWFMLLKKNIWSLHGLMSGISFAIGLTILGCGTYAAVADITHNFQSGMTKGAFSCNPIN